ncbi:MAG: nicotinate (nicotinamide) nucleotide adenylyltransferase [Planctomycetaceae bacterium]|nr:nicotinate (nicotinamide) nucleotide adenylyltransferase [Planctomycetaceae bacterium]
MARIGLIGGSFDPIHYGHLLLAESGLEQCALDAVWFVPTDISPFKESGSQATNQQRVEMLTLGIAGHKQFEINRCELKRGGISYTFETLETLTADNPDDEFFFLMGADSLADFPAWKNPQRICELVTLVLVSRSGCPELDFQSLTEIAGADYVSKVRNHLVAMPAIDFSSSQIRQRVTAEQSIRFRLPKSVEQYIHHNQLYQPAENT